MSTKTTFKRIALVAVAALGLGMLSAVPSSAALQSGAGTVLYNYGPTDSPVKPAILISPDSATNKAILVMKDEFYATAASDVDTLTVSAVTNVRNSAGALNPTFPAWRNTFANEVNATGARLSDTSKVTFTSTAAGVTSGEAILDFIPTYAGTYVFRITATSGWSYDWTVTAVLPDTAPNAAKTTSVLIAGAAAAPTVAATDDVVSAPKAATTAAGSQAGYALVTTNNAAGTSLVATTALTVTVSGPGLVGIGTNRANLVPQGRAITGAAGSNLVGIFADGTAGVSTITISAGTTVLATETVSFYGAVASITATVNRPVITYGTSNVKWYDGNNITVVAKDALGITVPSAGFTVASSTPTVCSNWSDGGARGLYGIAAGACEATVTSTQTTTVSTTLKTTIVGTPSKATVSFDKETYYVGEAMKITVSYKDANGLATGAAVYTSALGSSVSLTADRGSIGGTIITATANNDDATLAAVAGGYTNTAAATFSKATAPLVPGTVTLSFTDIAGNVITKSVSVIGDTTAADNAQAATDAAAEATDAANAATDAANAAAEAADAATAAAQDAADAVAALSTQVAEMIDALKKQITALTNLVIKIQKKVKA